MKHLEYMRINLLARIVLALLVIASHPITAADRQPATSSNSDQVVRAGASFSWLEGGRIFYDAPRFKGQPIAFFVNEAILEVLTEKGFHFVPSSEQSEFLVGYTVLLGNPLTDEQAEAISKRDPSLAKADPGSLEEGQFVIKVVEPKMRRSIWTRVSNKFAAALEFPQVERNKRIHAIVRELLAPFPNRENQGP